MADDLLDEERVSLRLHVQRPAERRGGPDAGTQLDELGRLGLAETRDLDLRDEPLASQLGQRRREPGGMRLGRPVGAEHEHATVAGRPRDVPEQQQGRPIGPLEVVEHEQHRSGRGDLRQQTGDGLEQPVALGLRLGVDRRRQLRCAAAQLRDEPDQLGAVFTGA